MKTLTTLPLYTASAINKVSERGYDGWGKVSDISQYSEDCSNLVPSKSGIFETTNLGTRGEITLDKYPLKIRCKHVVQADSSCSEIKISYRSIAVMSDYTYDTCDYDGFRFGWTDDETDDFTATPLRCNCFGDGCDHDTFDYFFDYADNNDWVNHRDQNLGPEEFTINSNSFTLYFESDHEWNGGHVILDWVCVEPPTTTTTTTSTEPTTSTTSTTITTTTTTSTSTT